MVQHGLSNCSSHLDAMQAQILDQALMQADDQYQPVLTKFVQQGQHIPEDVLTNLSMLARFGICRQVKPFCQCKH